MSKHRLSPAPLPPPKRLHAAGGSHVVSLPGITFESALYDELILCIFSHLSWVDLCATQSTSRNWARLAADNELWRNLYLKVYGRARLRGARGFIGRTDGREVRALPGRAKTEDHKDWKWMFRISSNWRTGRCSVESSGDNGPLFSPAPSHEQEGMHILLAGPIIVLASSRESLACEIHLHGATGIKHILPCLSSRPGTPTRVTALCLDQSSPVSGDVRLAAFLSTGEFTIFHINHNHLASSIPKVTYVPSSFGRNFRSLSSVTNAVYHHPLLISLSENFSLSMYDVSSDNVVHTQTLTSFSSYPPASLVLSTPTSSTYKLVLAYGIHVYPKHWSVGATELVIAGPEHEPMTVISTRTIRSFDIPSGWIDERKLQSIRDQWSRKVSAISDTQTDGKWVVLAPTEDRTIDHPLVASAMYSPTTLQLYRLSLPTTASVASGQAKLTFVRNLHGQTGPVTSLALADGRCVSLGLNGGVWVWDLEAGTGAQVCEPSIDPVSTRKCALVFDERRVVTAGADRLVIRRFDV
ncbi:hypothetical protein BDZ89DRAFT_1017301 [Hymenopellis radicata]|nr:hypothetical protein BDZ89DRAFT_1017301 [Hymenopellis radicata]